MKKTSEHQLSATGITKRYGSCVALENISIDIQRGEFLTLLGPSGSGKTTLLMILAGFQTPCRGVLTEDGIDITKRPAEKRNFGMVFQGYALFPHMSVCENIAFPLRIRGMASANRCRKVEHMLEVVGLSAHGNKYPHQLSGGQQQRVAIARALVFEPDMLLLDEPLSALDKNLREQLQVELKRIHHQVGTSFVFVTHDQEEALALSSRVAIFNKGRLIQIDTPDAIYSDPGNRFVAEFLGKMNLFPVTGVTRDGAILSGRCGEVVLRSRAGQISGGDQLLGVRPEHMELHLTTPVTDGTHNIDNLVQATVTERIYKGVKMQLTLRSRMAGIPFFLDVPVQHPATRIDPEVAVWVTWPIERSILLAA